MGTEHHECDHHHGSAHGHSHAPANFGTAFALGVVLNGGFVAAEVTYGLMGHSLALVADAGHNLGDVLGLLLAWGAAVWGRKGAQGRHTYGWQRSSILAALANASFLLITVGVIAWEAIRRLQEPTAVSTAIMIWVSAAGIVINGLTALMFASGRKGDLNVRATFTHMAADALLSAGVVIAGIVITFTGWRWLDPAVSLVLSAVIVAGTWAVLRDSFGLALDAVPPDIDLDAVHAYLASRPDVVDVHHLHVWGLSTSEAALTAHLVVRSGRADNDLLHRIGHDLEDRFGIGHATIQFESPGGCPTPKPAEVESCGRNQLPARFN